MRGAPRAVQATCERHRNTSTGGGGSEAQASHPCSGAGCVRRTGGPWDGTSLGASVGSHEDGGRTSCPVHPPMDQERLAREVLICHGYSPWHLARAKEVRKLR